MTQSRKGAKKTIRNTAALCALAPLRQKFSRIHLLLAALLFLYPTQVAALPLADYEKNIQRAIVALDSLSQTDENETESDVATRLLGTLEGVRAVLPEHQTVETGSETFQVDNSWLHTSLNGVDKMNSEQQAKRITQVLETLRALETRVTELKTTGQLIDSKEQAKQKLENILARPQYVTGARGPNALSRLLQDFFRWLEKWLPKRRNVDPGRLNLITLIAQILVIGLAVTVLVYVGKTLLGRLGRARKVKTSKEREPRIVLGERLEPDATATDLLSEAEALARRGDLRAAIRKAYIALLVELGDRKLISLAHHKTNRDYLNSLTGIPQLHSQMRGLTDSFERHWYGFASATANDWQDFRAGYLAALQGGN